MPTLPDLVVALFARQLGVAARRQLLALASAKAVDGWVRHGLLIIVHRGVYRIRGAPITDEQAVLRCGDDSVAGPRVSCALFGLEGFALSDAIDVAVPLERRIGPVSFELVPLPLTAADRCTMAGLAALHVATSLIALAPSMGESNGVSRRTALAEGGSSRLTGCRPEHPAATIPVRRSCSSDSPAGR